MEFITQYALLLTFLALTAAYFFSQPTSFVKWLQKKNYQYEVSSGLYMLTPTEKFIFNSILFLTLSMFSIACVLYLPGHVSTMARRAYYYCAGDSGLMGMSSRQAAETLYGTATRAGDAILDATKDWAATAYSAAINKTAGAVATAGQEAVVGNVIGEQ